MIPIIKKPKAIWIEYSRPKGSRQIKERVREVLQREGAVSCGIVAVLYVLEWIREVIGRRFICSPTDGGPFSVLFPSVFLKSIAKFGNQKQEAEACSG